MGQTDVPRETVESSFMMPASQPTAWHSTVIRDRSLLGTADFSLQCFHPVSDPELEAVMKETGMWHQSLVS